MNNSELLAWDTDIQACLDKKDFSAIAEYIKENNRTILLKWQESDFEGLEKNLSMGSTVLQFFKAGLETMSEQRALLDIGTLLGTVESFQRLLYERGQANRDIARNTNQERHIKHLPEVISALETHGSMTHSEMGEYLGLRASTLSEAMKKILNTSFVQALSAGKFKVYSLTDAGIRYGRKLRSEKHEVSFDDLILFLRDEIDRMPDDNTKQQINAQFEALLRTIGGMAFFPKDSVTLFPSTGDITSEAVTLEAVNFMESYSQDGSKRKYIFGKNPASAENAVVRNPAISEPSSVITLTNQFIERSAANYGP